MRRDNNVIYSPPVDEECWYCAHTDCCLDAYRCPRKRKILKAFDY